tara:strand:+ start:144 stop:602 length:459 start_codon:yes stop_codon:yes gene_type:complete
MITITDTKTGKKNKYSYEDFKSKFQEDRNKQIKDEILKALETNYKKLDDTGHGIIAPCFFIKKIGLPDEYVFKFAKKHYSNYDSYKETLFDNDGNIVDYIFGVNNLDILDNLCRVIGWDKDKKSLYYSLYGRGSQAEVCIENINLHFKNKKN